jgi:hypothetical protein
VRVTFDLKALPSRALEKMENPDGEPYYEIGYDLVITFWTTLEFKIMWGDKVYGSAVAGYI